MLYLIFSFLFHLFFFCFFIFYYLLLLFYYFFFFFFQAEDGIRDAQESRGLGDVYKRQYQRRVRGRTVGMFGLSGVPRFPADTPDKKVAAEVDGMAPLRHFRVRKQDRAAGREDKSLDDRTSQHATSKSLSTHEHAARGRGEYFYGSTMGVGLLSSMPSSEKEYGDYSHFEHLREHDYEGRSTKFKVKPRLVRGQGKNYERMSYLHKTAVLH
eukprot:TRINITY_DN26379_c0_g1_i3.p1 TRINITY_DN26379_c0_g1~~TRINITY_DN26379_c0_g1_i3.p1  ORF type:complete len:212 (+),score=36.65 TRINITY_DN26379_c0_g1_i3:2-637(+)